MIPVQVDGLPPIEFDDDTPFEIIHSTVRRLTSQTPASNITGEYSPEVVQQSQKKLQDLFESTRQGVSEAPQKLSDLFQQGLGGAVETPGYMWDMGSMALTGKPQPNMIADLFKNVGGAVAGRDPQNLLELAVRNFGPSPGPEDLKMLPLFLAGGMKMLGKGAIKSGEKALVKSPLHAEALKYKTAEVDPKDLVFRESEQNRTQYVKDTFGETENFDPIVISNKGVIIDGHNRTTVAKERGDKLQAVIIKDSLYKKALDLGFDEPEIAAAAYFISNNDDALSNINAQFPGANVFNRAKQLTDIWNEAHDVARAGKTPHI